MKSVFLTTLMLGALALSHPLLAQTPCSLDPAWDGDGRLVADGSRLGEHIVVQPDGKVVVACNPFGDNDAYLKRYNADGSLDNTFGTAGRFTVEVAERRTSINDMVLHDGTLYLCGSTTTDIGGTNTYSFAAAVQGNGSSYVTTFGTGGVKRFNSGNTDFYTASGIAVDASGKVYVTGLEWLDNLYVVRLTGTGALDAAWDGDGISYVATNNANHWFEVNDIAIGLDGKAVVTGKKYRANNGSSIPNFWNVLVARFATSGALDNTFGTGGIGLYNSDSDNFDEGKVVHPAAGGGYVVIGNTYDNVDYDYAVLKLLANGDEDPAFGSAGWSVNDLQYTNEMEYLLNGAVMPDGRILCTGNQGSGDTVHFSLLMLTPGGQRDNTFAPTGLFLNIFNQNNNSSSSGLAVTGEGMIYLGGYTRTCANGVCGPLYMAVARYFGGTPLVGRAEAVGADWQLFPNPVQAGGTLSIQGLDAIDAAMVELIDLQGRVVARSSGARFALPHITPGIYLCRVQAGGQAYSRQVVVR